MKSPSYRLIPLPEEVQKDLDWATVEGNREEVEALRHLLRAANRKLEHARQVVKAEADRRGPAPAVIPFQR